MENDNLYHWVFRYNTMDDKWYATTRDHYSDLFSNMNSEHVLKSASINTLVDVINKTNGESSKINSLLKSNK